MIEETQKCNVWCQNTHVWVSNTKCWILLDWQFEWMDEYFLTFGYLHINVVISSLILAWKVQTYGKKDTTWNILGITSMDLISIDVLYNNVSILFLSALYFCQEARTSQQQRLIANHIALRSSRKCPPTSVKEFPSFLSQRRQKKIDEREKG